MTAWLPEFDDGLEYEEATDTFATTYDPDAPELFADIDIDGTHLYPIGNESWTWSIVEEGVSAPESPDDSQ